VREFPQPAAFAIGRATLGLIGLLVLCCSPRPLHAQQVSALDQQLFAAIDRRDLVAVENLLQQGAHIEARATNGVTPLMSAAESGNVPLVSLLLEHGADAGARDDQGDAALTWAARGGWVKLVNLLEKFSDTKGKNGALFAAIEGGPVGSIEIDVSTLPNPTQHQAAEVEESWTGVAESLLDRGAEIEASDQDGSTPLISAAAFAQTDILKLLINRGARINVTDRLGNTPLISAACQCALATMNTADDVIEILLDQGANVNARNHAGRTALMMASGMSGDASVLELLLERGADLRAKDRSGKTALTFARESRREDKIEVLKKAYAETH
jgi:uncharacterized protein